MRGRTVRLGALLGALVIATSACATITYDAALVDGMVAMNRVAERGDYEVVGDFEVSQRPIFVIYSLLTVVDADLESALTQQLARTGGDAIINLRIHEEYDIIDFAVGLAQGILIGVQLAQTRSVTLTGDVIRWNGPQGAEVEALLLQNCREIDIPTEAGTRMGHLCLGPGAAHELAAAAAATP